MWLFVKPQVHVDFYRKSLFLVVLVLRSRRPFENITEAPPLSAKTPFSVASKHHYFTSITFCHVISQGYGGVYRYVYHPAEWRSPEGS